MTEQKQYDENKEELINFIKSLPTRGTMKHDEATRYSFIKLDPAWQTEVTRLKMVDSCSTCFENYAVEAHATALTKCMHWSQRIDQDNGKRGECVVPPSRVCTNIVSYF